MRHVHAANHAGHRAKQSRILMNSRHRRAEDEMPKSEDDTTGSAARDDATRKKSPCATGHIACHGARYKRRSRSRRTIPSLTWSEQSSPTHGGGHTERGHENFTRRVHWQRRRWSRRYYWRSSGRSSPRKRTSRLISRRKQPGRWNERTIGKLRRKSCKR
jgi:hypothetical protein